MKKVLPTLPNGKIDFSKIDRHNDFGLFPALYSTPEDIKKFIAERNLDVPVLTNILKLRRENKLDLTPTESLFYFQELFQYIYDVFRIPDEETYKDVEKWLFYIETCLVNGGLKHIIEEVFSFSTKRYMSFKQAFKGMGMRKNQPIINCYEDIEVKNKDYYEPSSSETLLHKFWIKSSRREGQPELIGEEAYMRVFVYPERVYIFGCDDCSYTLMTNESKERDEFVVYLKSAAPVWHFGYLSYIHPELKFTN